MNRRASAPSLGSISEGTLLTADLLSAFASELQSLIDERVQPTGAMSTGWRASFKKLLKEADAWDGGDEDDDDNETDGMEIVQELGDALGAFAPDYAYFGTAEGDGASFGFWVSWDLLQEDMRSGELRNDDDIPKGYTGLAVDVNDHGNTTLYRYQRGQKSEVWAVV